MRNSTEKGVTDEDMMQESLGKDSLALSKSHVSEAVVGDEQKEAPSR